MSKIRPAALAALRDSSTKECHFLFEDRPINIIGRRNDAFICIKSGNVSKEHCVISKHNEDEFSICDKSSNGTYVNGVRLQKNNAQVLNDRDSVCIAGLQNFTYEFVTNKKQKIMKRQSDIVSSRFKEQIIDLDTSHSEDIKNLTQMISGCEAERMDLQEELNSRLKAQEEQFNHERLSLSSLVSSSNEQRQEAEQRLKEVEERCDEEKQKLMSEIDEKLSGIAEKETELENMKALMEQQYQMDRKKLEERCKAEIDELKEKLLESEMEQWRLKEETLEVEQKLETTRKNLQEKEQVEKSLELKIVDLTEDSTSKEETLKYLQNKLNEKEQEEKRLKKDMVDLEEELQCSICSELFIETCVLNCGHLFCKSCIDQWKKKSKICPMCRASITSCARLHTMDAIINKNVTLLSDEAKARRSTTVEERVNSSKKPAKKQKTVHHHPITVPQVMPHHRPWMSPQIPPEFASSSYQSTHPFSNVTHSPVSRVALDLSEPDLFHWAPRRNTRRHEMPRLRVSSPVPVAAVDLTSPQTSPYLPLLLPRVPATNADTTIDLTSF